MVHAWMSLFLACRPDCEQRTSWETIPIGVDQQDDAHQDTAARVRATLQQLALWSDLDQVCVSEVLIKDQVMGGYRVEGSFRWSDARVQISPLALDPWQVTVHELCHAIDATEGISEARPELFPEEQLAAFYEEDNLIGGATDRTHEVFAQLCELGARDHARWRRVEEDCGVDYTDIDLDALTEVQEQVFPRAPRIPWQDPSFALTPGQEWSLGGQPTDLEAGSQALIGIWPAQRGEPSRRLRWLDPATGAELGRQFLPGTPRAYAYLEAGLPEPLLRTWFEGRSTLWALDPLGQQPPRRLYGCEGDLRIDGEMFTIIGGRDDALADLWVCDLESGETSRVTGPSDPGFALEQQFVWPVYPSLTSVHGRPALWWEGAGLTWLDPDGSTWHPVPLPWHLGLTDVLPARDGSGDAWLSLFTVYEGEAGEWLPARFVARYDAATQALEAPEDACAFLDPQEPGSLQLWPSGDVLVVERPLAEGSLEPGMQALRVE